MTADPTIMDRTIPIERSAKFYLRLFDRMRSTLPVCRACGGHVGEDGMIFDTLTGPFLACWECSDRAVGAKA